MDSSMLRRRMPAHLFPITVRGFAHRVIVSGVDLPAERGRETSRGRRRKERLETTAATCSGGGG